MSLCYLGLISPFLKFLLAHRIIFLAFDILKIGICFLRDSNSEHQDYMDMAECSSSTRALSSTPMDSLEGQVMPGSSTSPSKETIR